MLKPNLTSQNMGIDRTCFKQYHQRPEIIDALTQARSYFLLQNPISMSLPCRKSLSSTDSDPEKDNDSTEGLLRHSEDDVEAIGRTSQPTIPCRTKWLTALNIILFCFSFTIFAKEVYEKFGASYPKDWLLKQTSFYCQSCPI